MEDRSDCAVLDRHRFLQAIDVSISAPEQARHASNF